LKKMILLLEERLAVKNFKRTKLLLESMVGGGTELGTLEDLKITLDYFNRHENLGICLDTCHLFASGWDLRKKGEVDKLVDLLDDYFGLDKIKIVHLNDSLFPFKSYKDRHAPIGEGYLGDEGIRNVIKNKFLGNLPLILETPVDDYFEYGKEIEKVIKLL
ncbi:MAG TPA: deoxyribonuclease IV, partial [Firmicutes bacterium]|nr:deoxyribonuclease IV [Bacillota bacterium]